jgi:hypothetical protein
MGWNPVHDGSVNYIPIADNDMFNWTKEKLSTERLLEIAGLKEQENEVFGVDLYWENSQIGVTLLVFSHDEVSFCLDINTKYIDGDSLLVDYNWYAARILKGLFRQFGIEQCAFRFLY